jgi:hypothetical protein
MESADLSLAMVRTTPYRLILKLSWDNEWPANSDFVLRKRKKSAEAISGKQGVLPSPPLESWNEAAA